MIHPEEMKEDRADVAIWSGGPIALNVFIQDPLSFLRCTVYALAAQATRHFLSSEIQATIW